MCSCVAVSPDAEFEMSNYAIAVLAAICSAACFAASSALQHKAVNNSGQSLFKSIVRPAWLLGLALDGFGLGFQILALSKGPLILVQPTMLVGLVITLPFSSWLLKRRPQRSDITKAVVVSVSLGLFVLAMGDSTYNQSTGSVRAWVIAGIVLSLATAACVVGARHSSTVRFAALLGSAVGAIYAFTAALLQAATLDFEHDGLRALLEGWKLYGFALVGLFGFYLNQIAFRRGSIHAAITTISVVNPVVASCLGFGVFGDRPPTSGLAVATAVVALIVLLISSVLLSMNGVEEGTSIA